MDFSSKSVPVIAEYLRFWLGSAGDSVISDETLNYIIELTLAQNESASGCDIIFKSAISTLEWLIRKSEQGSAGTSVGASGELESFTEQVGEVTITKKFDVSGTTTSGKEAGWDRILSDLLADPNSIGCVVTQSEAVVKGVGECHFGGTSNEEYSRVKNNPDSRGAFSSYSAPYRQNLAGRKLY